MCLYLKGEKIKIKTYLVKKRFYFNCLQGGTNIILKLQFLVDIVYISTSSDLSTLTMERHHEDT